MSRRQRGVILTDRGKQRLEAAIASAQDQEKYGARFTQTELEDRTGLSIKTIKKILDQRVPTDEVSVRALFEAFSAFGLELEPSDYGLPKNPKMASSTSFSSIPKINQDQINSIKSKPEDQEKIIFEAKPDIILGSFNILSTEYRREDLSENIILEMVKIPDGNFLMGSLEENFLDCEKPQHKVYVKSFWMSKYQISQSQWRAIADLDKVSRELESDPSFFKGGNRPVENVSWYDSVEFCKRLTLRTGRNYSLPTEAEWEYACRAGTTTPFHFRESINTNLFNYDGSQECIDSNKKCFRRETTPIGYFGVPNTFGLYDMHGNVWEWCTDQWHDNYDNAPIDGSAWLSGDRKTPRLLRGGSWLDELTFCRSAYRYNNHPNFNSHYIGLRIVCHE
jgi:formylglycine-generating enzyme required for sulfatase activity